MAIRSLVVLAVLLSLGARPAQACKFGEPRIHLSDETRRATDAQAPRFTSAPTITVTRASAAEGSGCEKRASGDCSDAGSVRIAVPVSDDQTPPQECGFRLSLASGSLPAGLRLPTSDIRALDGEIILHWFEEDGTTPVDFALTVSPIDAAANEGEKVTLPFSSRDGGCSIVPGARPETWLLLLLLAFWCGLRRLGQIR
jgi:hypothetical protein